MVHRKERIVQNYIKNWDGNPYLLDVGADVFYKFIKRPPLILKINYLDTVDHYTAKKLIIHFMNQDAGHKDT